MTVRCGSSEHHVVYTRRDFRVLQSTQLPEGENFIVATGVYDNFSVARGQSTEASFMLPIQLPLVRISSLRIFSVGFLSEVLGVLLRINERHPYVT